MTARTMIDTHCHLNFHSFKKDYRAIAQAAFDAGVTKIINVGAKLDSSRRAVQIAKEIPYCFAAVGVHPHHADEYCIDSGWSLPRTAMRGRNDMDIEKELSTMIENDKKNGNKIVAIGECGLDYHNYNSTVETLHATSLQNKTQQTQLLLTHFKIAIRYHLPLILHCRDAYSDMINLLQTTNYRLLTPSVIHCFQGSLLDLKQFLNLGFYIGYDGYITYAKNYEELVRATPLNKILTETDSPWLTPVPLRGTRNTPANIKIICEKIAEIKSLPVGEIDKITTENAEKLFGI